ncbi:hypothetical protein AB0K45_09580 [Micrococcus luteus]|uniref:hypothetical protein n=1 Tax=Micrococcus luteus TaxID=1270 RepID=UPI00341AE7B5
MTETVIRHRGRERDENGKLTAEAAGVPLPVLEIEPGGGSETVERGRNTENVACTVYFEPGTDVKNSDELTVRGERFTIVVNDWLSGGRGGLEVLCTRGQG